MKPVRHTSCGIHRTAKFGCLIDLLTCHKRLVTRYGGSVTSTKVQISVAIYCSYSPKLPRIRQQFVISVLSALRPAIYYIKESMTRASQGVKSQVMSQQLCSIRVYGQMQSAFRHAGLWSRSRRLGLKTVLRRRPTNVLSR